MKPIQNTIHTKKNVTLLEIEAHCRVDGEEYMTIQRLFDPPIKLDSDDTAVITWNIKIEE